MNAAIFFYLADVLSSISIICAIFGIGGLAVSVFFTGIYVAENNKYHGRNWIWIGPGIALFVAALIPSQKTMYMMAAAVLGEQALETKVGQQLKELVELKLDEELKKLKEKK